MDNSSQDSFVDNAIFTQPSSFIINTLNKSITCHHPTTTSLSNTSLSIKSSKSQLNCATNTSYSIGPKSTLTDIKVTSELHNLTSNPINGIESKNSNSNMNIVDAMMVMMMAMNNNNNNNMNTDQSSALLLPPTSSSMVDSDDKSSCLELKNPHIIDHKIIKPNNMKTYNHNTSGRFQPLSCSNLPVKKRRLDWKEKCSTIDFDSSKLSNNDLSPSLSLPAFPSSSIDPQNLLVKHPSRKFSLNLSKFNANTNGHPIDKPKSNLSLFTDERPQSIPSAFYPDQPSFNGQFDLGNKIYN